MSLLLQDKSNINAATGRALVNKIPSETRKLIATMAANSQQFGTRASFDVKSSSK
ncbi:unnamed protein product, partial [Citrullus colocynthis]